MSGLETLRGTVDLAVTPPSDTIDGADPGDALGSGEPGAGLVVADVNGDGIDDIATAAPGSMGPGNAAAFAVGECAVVLGSRALQPDLWHGVSSPSPLSLLATGVTSPWDGSPGILDDRSLHFFRLDAAGGGDPTLFVTRQEREWTVRLSWLWVPEILHPVFRKFCPGSETMLREAGRALKRFTSQWAAYCAKQEDFTVLPLLVVQVEDAGGKRQVSETDIAQAMRTVREVVGTMSGDAFAHSFQEGMQLTINGDTLRYLAPSDIQDDAAVRVVFFKTSLNTGWDCPRAEVMMSFRAASDSTYIAQLVGRMVRTPLARRIVDNETLNTVALYLPHYDKKGLERVVAKLSKPDDGMPPVQVAESDDVAELRRAKGSDAAFDALSHLPSYVVPRKRKSSQVRRLFKFARLLTNDDIDEDALAAAKEALLKVINAEHAKLKKSAWFKAVVEDRGKIEIASVNWDVGTDGTTDGAPVKVDVAAENIDDLFEATGRKLNEGLHKIWWRERVRNAPQDMERAKLELFALGARVEVMTTVEVSAQTLVQKWLKSHAKQIGKLGEESRAMYDEIKQLAATPELTPPTHPSVVHTRQGDRAWEKHLYVDENEEYHVSAFTPPDGASVSGDGPFLR